MSEDNLQDYLTIKQAAKFLGVTAETLRNWDRKGKLIPYRNPLNRYRLYKLSDLEQLLIEIGQRDGASEESQK
ncbi:MAG: MerR family DNA-binding transcriptional regulator [Anaerolineae bacterium]|nr:MAG: MerR family DNA-binding transcriptional regulator [Anaerolineae bacterium]